MQCTPGEDPAGMSPPRTLVGRMRIALLVGVLMMHAMRSHPENWPTLKRHRAARGQKILKPARDLVAAMRQQPMIGHADAYVDREKVHDCRDDEILPRKEEQRRDRPDVEGSHEGARDPVDAAFLVGAAHAQILLQALVRSADSCESIGFSGD